MTTLQVIALGAALLLVYVYAGYPALLRLLVRVRGPRPIAKRNIRPTVSLVISAFNEAATMRAKLENTLALDYPPDVLDIVVVSDASSDGTDEIVNEYAARGVRLFRQPTRQGKTAGLNRVLPTLTAEIVVFSDANALYAPDALLKLVSNFGDPQVGCVTGEARYTGGGGTAADEGERAYWSYEIEIKRRETDLGSMVGGDGALYGIRRRLWQPLPENAINDFLNPLQIVAAGYRAVYEPEAVCYEETAGDARAEYRRRVRIVSRSWRAIFQAPRVLNPLRVGLFTWSVLSHKVLRWFSGLFAAIIAAAGIAELVPLALAWPRATAAAVLAVSATLVARSPRQAIAMAVYFAIINTASFIGVLNGTLGRVSGVWAPARQAAGDHRRPVAVGQLFLLIVPGTLAATTGGLALLDSTLAMRTAFWSSIALMAYVYVGYPVAMVVFARARRRPIQKADIEPSVCLFITANNEEAVIEAKVKNSLRLEYPAAKLDIVVASDGSVDGTNDIVRRFGGRVRLLPFTTRRGKIAAINEGIGAVTSEIVVFTDANTFLHHEAIRAIVRNFADSRVGAVSGDVVLEGDRAALGRSEDLYYRYERWLQQAESGIGSMIGADGALYAIRRELFTAPADDTILDDMAIPLAVIRSGHRVVFERDALGFERGCDTAREEFARKSRVVAGAVQFLCRLDSSVPRRDRQVMFSLVSHKILRWLSPLFWSTALITSFALAADSSTYALAASAQGLVLVWGLAGCIPALRWVSVVAMSHYFCLLQAATAWGIVRGLTGRQSVRWQRFVRVTG